ncbi:hypothetical protein L1887_09045 [Cichorium endivia]|nr:hypothetical protein L1887_09045 [Cichorium endivia]
MSERYESMKPIFDRNLLLGPIISSSTVRPIPNGSYSIKYPKWVRTEETQKTGLSYNNIMPSDLGLHLRQLKNPTITMFVILHSKLGFPLLIFSSSPPENLNRRG